MDCHSCIIRPCTDLARSHLLLASGWSRVVKANCCKSFIDGDRPTVSFSPAAQFVFFQMFWNWNSVRTSTTVQRKCLPLANNFSGWFCCPVCCHYMQAICLQKCVFDKKYEPFDPQKLLLPIFLCWFLSWLTAANKSGAEESCALPAITCSRVALKMIPASCLSPWGQVRILSFVSLTPSLSRVGSQSSVFVECNFNSLLQNFQQQNFVLHERRNSVEQSPLVLWWTCVVCVITDETEQLFTCRRWGFGLSCFRLKIVHKKKYNFGTLLVNDQKQPRKDIFVLADVNCNRAVTFHKWLIYTGKPYLISEKQFALHSSTLGGVVRQLSQHVQNWRFWMRQLSFFSVAEEVSPTHEDWGENFSLLFLRLLQKFPTCSFVHFYIRTLYCSYLFKCCLIRVHRRRLCQ